MIGYHASHEQFPPSLLLQLAAHAEQAGFTSIHCSDHFHPWSKRQGESGFSLSWIGASMARSALPFGTVCTPGYRYHPAVIAQAIATLGEMFPQRFWISLGSGEAINEIITGENWPLKDKRNARLMECFTVIRDLLDGKETNHDGLVKVMKARLYTLPKIKPLLLGAAVSAETAKLMGSIADGMITIHRPFEELKEVVHAFRNNGGEGKPVYLKIQLSFAGSEEEAFMGAWDQWRTNTLPGNMLTDLATVEEFDSYSNKIDEEEFRKMVRISSRLQDHIDWIRQDLELGFNKIILHNVNRQQEIFIDQFGKKVLPLFS